MSKTPNFDKEALAPKVLNTKDTLGFCVVGLGRAGGFHLASMRQLRQAATLRWAVDANIEKAKQCAAEFGCAYDSDIEKALQDPAVDCIVISSTTDTHFGYIMRALRAGKSVFAEKPISHDPAEVREAVELALEKNVVFIVGYQRRVDKNFRELKRQIDTGSIGAVRVIKCCSRDNPIPPMAYLKSSGGIFHDMLCHDLDMVHWLSGGQMPESILSHGHCYHDEIRRMGDLDTVVVTLKFASGLMATIDTCREASYGYDQRIEVMGDKGMARAENVRTDMVEIATRQGFLTPPTEWSFPQRYYAAYAVEMAEFVALVNAGAGQALRHEQTIMKRHTDIEKVTAAAEISYKLGRQIHLKDLDKAREEAANIPFAGHLPPKFTPSKL